MSNPISLYATDEATFLEEMARYERAMEADEDYELACEDISPLDSDFCWVDFEEAAGCEQLSAQERLWLEWVAATLSGSSETWRGFEPAEADWVTVFMAPAQVLALEARLEGLDLERLQAKVGDALESLEDAADFLQVMNAYREVVRSAATAGQGLFGRVWV